EVARADAGLEERLAAAARDIMARTQIEVERSADEGRRRVDIRPGLESLEVSAGSEKGTARIRMTLPHREFTVKPAEVISVLAEAVPGIVTRSVHRSRLILDADSSQQKGGDQVCPRKSS
ncbi:MAG: hypothetical protein ACPL7K_07025, partial [Armatimonadota bacterium]